VAKRRTKRTPKRTLKPRTPSRVKKRRKQRGRHHHELIGLGLVALGFFLATLLYLGFDGGVVGGGIADGVRTRYARWRASARPLLGTVCLLQGLGEAMRVGE